MGDELGVMRSTMRLPWRVWLLGVSKMRVLLMKTGLRTMADTSVCFYLVGGLPSAG